MNTEWNRLHDLFQQERKSLVRWFYSLVTLAVFIVLVFWPYIRIVQSLDLIEHGIASSTARIHQVKSVVETVTHGIERASSLIGDASSYRELYRKTENWVSSLDELNLIYDQKSRLIASLRSVLSPEENADWLEGSAPDPDIMKILIRERPDQAKLLHSVSSCFWQQEGRWVLCEIASARSEIDKQLGRLLYDRTSSHELTAKLRDKIRQNREQFLGGLNNALSLEQLPDWTREYLDKEQHEIRLWFEELARQRLQLIQDRKKQGQQLALMEKDKADLNERKKEISEIRKLDTPWGELPVGFDDFLALLPALVLMSGIALLISQMRLLCLRHGMHEMNERFESVTDQSKHWRLILPIWFDPLNGRLNNSCVALLFIAPALTAIVALIALYGLPPAVNENWRIDSSALLVMIVALSTIYLWVYIRLVMAFNMYGEFVRQLNEQS
jgi:hypothetical protein